ncbi:Membrane protein [Cupriavidus taiwanensis]|uniref:Membrane protein n=1 Tax=Cupriavidus taiwanensis TaxID=164546 RepID=A0A975XB28_9BURK|nr:outer membrane protein transport protein [Cupriavidus taiwanensis]SOY64331.1 Membrane protein [Cupriavidus taiwanensis]
MHLSDLSRVARGGLCAGALGLLAGPAQATNGTFMTGYGFKAASMGGASIGLAQDALSAANNPAGMAYVGNRFDIDLATFNGTADVTFGSAQNPHSTHIVTPSPEFGVNYQLSPEVTVGLSVYGMGEKTDYGNPLLPVPGAQVAKSFLLQLSVAPTITYKIDPTLAIGVSLIGGFEQFRASGFIAPTPAGTLVGLPSHGTATAFGYGAAAGVLWQPVPEFSVGASYYTKMRYGRLAGYDSDILASYNGRIDGPQRYGIGVAFKPVERLTIAADWLHIDWDSVASLSDPATFGWRDQNVFRVGASYALGSRWLLMAGFSYGSSHVDSDHLLANVFSPATSTKALTFGASYRINASHEVSIGYEHTLPRSMTGTGPSTGTNIKARYDFFRLAYSYRF